MPGTEEEVVAADTISPAAAVPAQENVQVAAEIVAPATVAAASLAASPAPAIASAAPAGAALPGDAMPTPASLAAPAQAMPMLDPAQAGGGFGGKGRQKGGGKPRWHDMPHSPGASVPLLGAAALSTLGDTFAAAEAAAAGQPKQPLDLKHERLVGNVFKYDPTNGWGFVKSHLFQGDLVFRTDRIMPEFQGHPLQETESVEFDVQADDHGRPHAVMLKPVLGRKPYECLGQRHRGYVRRFADRWGFLNAAAFDGDLFVHRDNLLPVPDQLSDGQPPLRAGQAVEFDVALDDRGRAVAKQIATRALLRPCDWMSHRLRGFIRSFQGAWGFINSDRFAGDLFVHRDSLLAPYVGAQLTVGTVVEFDVERDHHRKGTKNRLVARHVAVLGSDGSQPVVAATYSTAVTPQQPMPQMPQMHQQQQQPMVSPYDQYSGMQPVQPLSPQGALNPQANSFAPAQPSAPVQYYQQQQQPLDIYGRPAAGMQQQQPLDIYGNPQYQYAQPPYQYAQQPMMPTPQLPPMQQPVMQQPYAQQYAQPPMQYAQPPMPVQPQVAVLPTIPIMPQLQQQQAYMQPGMAPVQSAEAMAGAVMGTMGGMPPMQGAMPGTMPGEPPKADAAGNQEGPQLHITMHDWEPDQPGQLWVTKGTLVNVSYRAAHGWVYAGTVQPGAEGVEPASEGWIPQAVVKRVSLCRVAIDWPAEGSGTLGVTKGEIIAVSKHAERGWVYGERIGPRQPDLPADGWLPRKVLDYLQT